jgi:hypothetical protein
MNIIQKNNKSLILKGLELILEKIINGKIKTENFLKIDKNYIKILASLLVSR